MVEVTSSGSEAGKELSKLGAAKGGAARAKALTSEQRSAIARAAVEARWKKAGKSGPAIPQATHQGELPIGSVTIPCAVLEDGTRVLTQEGFLVAIGRAPKAKAGTGSMVTVDGVPPFLTANNLKPFISNELLRSTTPIMFKNVSGVRAFGFKAELLPEVCDVFLAARQTGKLLSNQMHIADKCEILVRGFARVGIIALVDEATGFQQDRDKNALGKILEAFISKELRKWVRTFPYEYYEQIFRLKGIEITSVTRKGKNKRPQWIGKITNNLVYDRLAPGVLADLRSKNPANEHGQRPAKHHQWLTGDIGHPRLREHLASVIALMKAANTWDQFKEMLERALPKYQNMPLFKQAEGEVVSG